MAPDQRLERDAASVLAIRRTLLAGTGGRTDERRLLVVMSATGGAELHLPRSLPLLLKQTRAMNRSVDLLIGCNNGFESPALTAYLEEDSGCGVTRGYCTKTAADEPAPIVDEAGTRLAIGTGNPGEDRCFLIHQRAAPDAPPGLAAGKTRMLGDLYGLIEHSIFSGWRPPQYLLACDAESEFDQLAPWSTDGFGEPGLALLIARLESEPRMDLVGTRNRFVVFETSQKAVRYPRPDWRLPSMQLYMNLVHAQAHGFMWLPGGGTLGRTETLAALFVFVARAYPSVRVEDTMITVLAHAAGFGVTHEPRVTSLNRCAPAAENALATDQIERYLCGQRDLVDKFHRQTERIVPMGTLCIVAAGYRRAAEEIRAARSAKKMLGMLANTGRILGALPKYLHVARGARQDRSDDPRASASW